MPNTLDHQTCREKICLLCFKKAKIKQISDTRSTEARSGTRGMTERVKDLIERHALPHYRNYGDLISLPKVVCETCRQKLEKKEKGKNVTITAPKLSKFLEYEMLPTGSIRVSQCVVFHSYLT